MNRQRGTRRARAKRSLLVSARNRHLAPRRFPTLRLIEMLEPRTLLSVNVLSNHYDAGSTGQNLTETVLTPSNVNSTSFGKVFTATLDGQIYAQILAVANVNITRGSSLGIHNVLYAATMHNSLYAIDANTGAILWQDSFDQIADPRVTTIGSPSPTAGVTTIPAVSGDNALVNGSDIGPELGILATPTIDPNTGILYLVADTQEFRNGTTPVSSFTSGTTDIHYVQRLWAVNIVDGSVAITPTNNPPSSVEPTTGGQIVADTILNPRSGSTPSFSSYNQTSFTVSSLTRSGTTATATISSTTGMHVGDSITISGATPSGYNGTFMISAVTSSTTFQYTVPNTLTSPATGTITAKWGANYKYVAGPFIKGTGNNTDTFNGNGTVATTDNADSWGFNQTDTLSIFAGTTPSRSGYIAFNALLQMNRVATTLINGEIYLGFASHGDDGPYYGWLLGYNASTLANNAAFVTVPTFDGVKGSAGFTSVGGLWASGGGITTDGTYLYFTVGNGSFNPATSNFNSTYVSTNNVQLPLDSDYGDSILKVAFDLNATQANVNLANSAAGNPTPDGTYNPDGGYNVNGFGMKVVDYFTPSNVYQLNKNDEDIGSGGVLMLPTSGPGAVTAHYDNVNQVYTVEHNTTGDSILVFAGKEGRIYMVDASNLGGFNTGYDVSGGPNTSNADPAPFDRIIGEFYYYQYNGHPTTLANNQTYKGYDIPSYFNGELYIGLGGGSTGTRYVPELGFDVTAFPFVPGATSSRTGIEPVPNFTSDTTGSTSLFGGRGNTSATSADGLTNGIIWANNVTQTSTDFLVAYSASAIGSGILPIYTSNDNVARDQLTGGTSGATGVKFSIPTVFNGMVYDATGGGSGTGGHILGTVVGYGLLNTVLSAPTSLNLSATSPTTTHLTWTRNTTTETEEQVQRSINGVTWTTVAYLPNGTTSFDDSGLSPGTHYFYRVIAISGPNSSTPSSSANITTPSPALASAISRKQSGVINLDLNLALSGNPTIEARLNGPTSIILTFAQAIDTSTITSPLSLTLSSGSGSAAYLDSTHIAITLSGAIDGQVLVVNLSGVHGTAGGTAGNYTLNVGVLLGDVDGSGAVNVADVAYVKLNSGQPVSAANVLDDIDSSNAINVADVSYVKAHSGNNLDYGNITSGGDVIPVPELITGSSESPPLAVSFTSVSAPASTAPVVTDDLAPATSTTSNSTMTETQNSAGSTTIGSAPYNGPTSIVVASTELKMSHGNAPNDAGLHWLVLSNNDFLLSAALPFATHKKTSVSESTCEDAFFDSLGSAP